MKLLLGLLTEIFGEFAFWVISVVWFFVCTIGLGLLGVPIGYHPKYGVIVGAVIGVVLPFVWWVKRQIAEQRELAE